MKKNIRRGITISVNDLLTTQVEMFCAGAEITKELIEEYKQPRLAYYLGIINHDDLPGALKGKTAEELNELLRLTEYHFIPIKP